MDEQERKEYICSDCGRVITEDELDDCLRGENRWGKEIIICPDCESEWTECKDCGALELKDNMAYCEDDGKYYCEDCEEDNVFWCEHCETYRLREYCDENMHEVRVSTWDTEVWCEECCNDDAFFCEECEQYFDGDYFDAHTDSRGRTVCEDCYDGGRADYRIKGYHDAPSQIWYGKMKSQWRRRAYGSTKMRGLGFELESDGGGDFEEAIDGIQDAIGEDRVYFEEDGSLTEGFETISQPHTVEEFWAQKEKWAQMLQAIKDAGFTSHDAGTCGLHVHFSREMFGANGYKQNLAVAKILYFFENYQQDIKRISRRADMRWCHFNNLPTTFTKWTRAQYLARANQRYNDHGTIINTGNTDTVEFRLFRGTLNEKSFFATFDFLINLVKNSRTMKWKDCTDVAKWLKGMSGETLEYIRSRHAFENVLANITAQDEEEYLTEEA